MSSQCLNRKPPLLWRMYPPAHCSSSVLAGNCHGEAGHSAYLESGMSGSRHDSPQKCWPRLNLPFHCPSRSKHQVMRVFGKVQSRKPVTSSVLLLGVLGVQRLQLFEPRCWPSEQSLVNKRKPAYGLWIMSEDLWCLFWLWLPVTGGWSATNYLCSVTLFCARAQAVS